MYSRMVSDVGNIFQILPSLPRMVGEVQFPRVRDSELVIRYDWHYTLGLEEYYCRYRHSIIDY